METTGWKCPQCETLNDADAEVCVVCGGAKADATALEVAALPIGTDAGYVTPYTTTATAANTAALNALRKKLKLVSIVAALLIVAACCVSVLLYNRTLQLSDQLSESVLKVDTLEEQCQTLTADLQDKDKEIAKQKSTINDLKSEKNKLASNASKWNSFTSKTSGKSLGYGSARFYMNKGVVVLPSSSASQKLTLTCNFGVYVTVNLSTEGISATLDFDQSSWSGSTTTMTLRPHSTGITYFTFTNSVDSSRFTVVAIVI